MFKKNYIDLLMNDELKKFIVDNGSKAIMQTTTKDFVKGNVVVKVPLNRRSISDLLNGARNIHIETSENVEYLKAHNKVYPDGDSGRQGRLGHLNLFKDTTNRIIKIDTQMSFEEALNMSIKFRNKLGSKFYGVLFKVYGMENTLINPFHILTALSSVSEYGTNKSGVMDVKNHKFYPIIYILEKEELLDVSYLSMLADLEKIDTNINCLMHCFGSKTQSKTKITGSNVENLDNEKLNKIKSGAMNIEIKYIETVDQNSGDDEENEETNNYVIAHQLMANGVVAPFYGASLVKIKKDLSDSKGTRLTPMPTCNIAGSDSNYSNVIFDSVCTGSTLKNTTIDGLRTQTHVNYGSPYGSSKNFLPGCLIYARRMIERSLEIYRRVNLFNFEEPEDVALDYDSIIEKTIEYSKEEFNSRDCLIDTSYANEISSELR